MARGRPTKADDFDWHLELDPTKRRRAQNREAQRRFRTPNPVILIHSGPRRYLANKAQGRETKSERLLTSSGDYCVRHGNLRRLVSTLHTGLKRSGGLAGPCSTASEAFVGLVETNFSRQTLWAVAEMDSCLHRTLQFGKVEDGTERATG